MKIIYPFYFINDLSVLISLNEKLYQLTDTHLFNEIEEGERERSIVRF